MKMSRSLLYLASVAASLWLMPAPVCHAASVADAISVAGAYARAVPPGLPNSAAFMALHNGSDADHALVAAESPAAKIVELHAHTMDGGMMRMRPVEQVALPAGRSVVLEPGGLHLMLIGLERTLVVGEQLPITLIFDDGSRVQVQVPVRPVEAGSGHSRHH